MTGGLELFADDPMPADEVEVRLSRINVHVDQMWPDVIAIYQGRGWVSLGYESFKELCDERMRVRPALAIEERRETTAVLSESGMSTRAIASALGVHKDTVRNDLAGGEYSPPAQTTGLDGKIYTRPPTTPPGWEAAKRRADDYAPDDTAAQAVEEFIHADGSVRRANLRADFAKWLYQIGKAHLFDVEEMASLVQDDDRESAERVFNRLTEWGTAYLKATAPKTGLRLIGGDR